MVRFPPLLIAVLLACWNFSRRLYPSKFIQQFRIEGAWAA